MESISGLSILLYVHITIEKVVRCMVDFRSSVGYCVERYDKYIHAVIEVGHHSRYIFDSDERSNNFQLSLSAHDGIRQFPASDTSLPGRGHSDR